MRSFQRILKTTKKKAVYYVVMTAKLRYVIDATRFGVKVVIILGLDNSWNLHNLFNADQQFPRR